MRCQPGGRAMPAVPDGSRSTVQPVGGGTGRSHAKGPGAGWTATGADDPPQLATARAAAASAMAASGRLERAIAVARTAVVVGVVVATVVLRDAARLLVVVTVVAVDVCLGGSAQGDGQRGREGERAEQDPAKTSDHCGGFLPCWVRLRGRRPAADLPPAPDPQGPLSLSAPRARRRRRRPRADGARPAGR